MRLTFALAEPRDASDVTALRVATARDLTARFGRGHWSSEPSVRGVLADMRRSEVWLARRGETAVGTFAVSTRKPWAIDRSYFQPSACPLYVTNMAVQPDLQGQGVGRRCIEEIVRIAIAWPTDALRLDAYDADAGAGIFYAKCGFTEVGRVSYRGVPLVYYERLL